MKATWPQALRTFFLPIFGVLVFRWLLLEPFVIPSGSMIPTLLVHDHILVNKLSYGIHLPFSQSWVWQWRHPQRRDVVVFRYPPQPEVFYVKRVIAVGGDSLKIENGQIWVNGTPVPQASTPALNSGQGDETEFDHFLELGVTVRYRSNLREGSSFREMRIPEGSFFVVGDNRDQSYDSRFWGVVPESHLIGKASLVWLSCDKTLQSAPFICDPQSMRWSRMFRGMQ